MLKWMILALVAFLVVLGAALVWVKVISPPGIGPQVGVQKTTETAAYKPIPRAPTVATNLSTSTREALAKSKGAQFLISFTNTGFEPADISVKKGADIRFSNNSSKSMHIVSVSVYPEKGECGANAFDTCVSIPVHEFWELVFDVSGTWTYRDVGSGRTGIVRVQ